VLCLYPHRSGEVYGKFYLMPRAEVAVTSL
jgi:hypothetical protein